MDNTFSRATLLGMTVAIGALTNGAQSALGITVADYGAPVGEQIAITVDRTALMCAPDSVRFSVDLSNANFDTPAPTSGHYDQRFHDLIFVWDTGDAGVWNAPQNILPQWNDKSRARGPIFAHCYTTPGVKTVTLTVIEQSSGKVGQASVNFNVADPDIVFAAAQTVCINPVGDTDFTGAPAGAQTFSMDGVSVLATDQSWWGPLQDTSARRYLFKGGATYGQIGFDYTSNVNGPHPMFSTYGTGQATILIPFGDGVDPPNSGRLFYPTPEYLDLVDFRIQNIEAIGNFDPDTQYQEDASAEFNSRNMIRSNTHLDLIIQNCRVSNTRNSGIYMGMNGAGVDNPGYLHIDDTVVENFGGQYGGIFASPHDELPDSWLSITGTRVVQSPTALSSGRIMRGLIRENGVHQLYCNCFDIFGKADSNAALKILTTPQDPNVNHVANITNMAIEGNFAPIQIGQNTGSVSTGIGTIDANIVMDGILVVSDYSSVMFMDSHISGVTVRNLLGIIPNTPRFHDSSVVGFAQNSEERPAPDIGVTYTSRRITDIIALRVAETPQHVQRPQDVAGRIAIYNCTFRSDRSSTDNGGISPDGFEIDPSLTNVVIENNIIEGEMLPGQTGSTPLSDTILFVPRNIGFKGAVSGPGLLTQNAHVNGIVSEFATPVDGVKQSAPLAGSAALGGATTGLKAFHDITGAVRPTTVDDGASQESP